MKIASIIFISLVALIHFYFMLLEMHYWTKPKGLKAFGISKEFAEKSKTLAANQGLYNGFLAAGLCWSLFQNTTAISIFFLTCVIIAGLYGSYSLKKRAIFYIQALPAIIALILTILI